MSELTQVLRRLLPVEDPNALVDASSGDDAAVYRLSANRALVVSVDFFTPIVDDPYEFGRIGAANALSDVYAMGARPLFGLNLVCFPRKLLGEGLLEEIIAGGASTCREAGIPVLGGHSIDDPEPKFGMVAVGEVQLDRLVTNSAARPGDKLVLTKPLGSGIVATAIKADAASPEVIAKAVEVMTALNDRAAQAMAKAGVKAATDVTGFGLLGHLRSMLRSSGAAAVIQAGAVRVLPGAIALAEAGHVPGGTRRNHEDLRDDVSFAAKIPDALRTVLVDAQTSGGLLIAVPAAALDGLLAELAAARCEAAVVGEVTEGRAGAITVT
jgi:selenide,water dikinase